MDEEAIARLHAKAQADDRRVRQSFVFAIQERDPRRQLADAIELKVKWRLEDLGYLVVAQTHKERFDLLVQGVRVEVKAATWDGEQYQANLHGNQADVLVFACIDGAAHYFVIPFGEVSSLRMLKISSHDPRDYIGKWMRYYAAWELIDELVAAGCNAWQPALMEI